MIGARFGEFMLTNKIVNIYLLLLEVGRSKSTTTKWEVIYCLLIVTVIIDQLFVFLEFQDLSRIVLVYSL